MPALSLPPFLTPSSLLFHSPCLLPSGVTFLCVPLPQNSESQKRRPKPKRLQLVAAQQRKDAAFVVTLLDSSIWPARLLVYPEQMGMSEAGGMKDWYAELIQRMTTPSFVVDNDVCSSATVIEVISVEGMNKQGLLLEVVHILADLDLVITKANMSYDAEWFMDVFHVTDAEGNKLQNEIIDKIKESLGILGPLRSPQAAATSSTMLTSIELTGADRPGLLSDVCAVLRDMNCNVVEGYLWTHNARTAAVVDVTDESTGLAIENLERIAAIEELLRNVVRNSNGARARNMMVPTGATHIERRLHRMLLAERDYERAAAEPPASGAESGVNGRRSQVSLSYCLEKDYSVVTLRSKDRPKLLFDTLFTLTDLQYVVFHGTVITGGMEAWQEYYIRHVDGLPIRSEAESQRVIQCLEAAIERRASEGLELELQTDDRVGLLSDITRIFRENGLSIRKAEISTKGSKAVDTFCVSDVSGSAVDPQTVESIRKQIAQMGKATAIRVKGNHPHVAPLKHPAETTGFLLGSLLRACSFQSFRLVRSYS